MEVTLERQVKTMHHIEMTEAKLQVERLLQAALDGDEVIITQNSEPVLKLVRVSQPEKQRQSGTAKGLIEMSDDFDEPSEFVPNRKDVVRRIDELRERLFAKYGEMLDSVELIREDRAR